MIKGRVFIDKFEEAYGKDFGLGRLRELCRTMQRCGYFPIYNTPVTVEHAAFFLTALTCVKNPTDPDECYRELKTLGPPFFSMDPDYIRPEPVANLVEKQINYLLSHPDELEKVESIVVSGKYEGIVFYKGDPIPKKIKPVELSQGRVAKLILVPQDVLKFVAQLIY